MDLPCLVWHVGIMNPLTARAKPITSNVGSHRVEQWPKLHAKYARVLNRAMIQARSPFAKSAQI